MKRMKQVISGRWSVVGRTFLLCVLCVLCGGSVLAQDAPEPNAGVRFEMCASYSVNGESQDQATELCARVPFTSRWSAQYAAVFAPSLGDAGGVNFHFAEALYSRTLADFFKRSSPQFNPERIELRAFGGVGTARNAIGQGNASFAWSAGGCGSFRLAKGTAVEACYRYVRSRIVDGGTLLRSDHQLPVGLIFSW